MNRRARTVDTHAFLMLVLVAFVLASERRSDAAGQTATASISGTTTGTNGAPLSGVEVALLLPASDAPLSRVTSTGDGLFSFDNLSSGNYRLRATLSGFARVEVPVSLAPGQHVQLAIHLALAGRVDQTARASADTMSADVAAAREVVPGRALALAPLTDDRFASLLTFLPGVVRDQDGHISMKGGRPSQSGLQVGRASAIDPVTGEWGYALPAEVIDEVDVLPNDYAADIGRFSSGVAQIQTRKGTNEWRPATSGLLPIPRWRHRAFTGINSWNPTVAMAGPLVKDRLFLLEGVEYEIDRIPVGSLPDGADETRFTRVNAFTRLDAVLSPRHWLTATATIFPSHLHYLGLGPFSPQQVSPSADQRGTEFGASELASVGQGSVLESAVTAREYDVDIVPGGDLPMTISPSGRSGSFFNTQHRTSNTVQWTETMTTSRAGPIGQHLLSAGIDVLHERFDGSSSSRPVIVRRADGTVFEEIDFLGQGIQHVASTEPSAFGQDRWRVSDRASLEFGVRWDRDGVLHRDNWAPRVGATLAVLAHGRGIVRGGFGWFYGRTPLNIAAFGQYETATITRFAVDGLTPLAPPLVFAQRADPDLATARSASWNVEYDHQWTPTIVMRVNHFERQGSHEPLLEPVESAATAAWVLDDRGRSRYQETEFTVRYGPRAGFDLNVSYVYSHAEADLNAFDSFYSNIRDPIVRPDQYSLTNIDVPHRVLIRGTIPVASHWALTPLIEARNGFPYSILDEDQNVVGTRNRDQRFPFVVTVDLGVSRLITIRERNIWVGLRVSHVLDGFVPRDVQNNIGSPAFGTFYNGIPRRYSLTFYVQP